MTSVEDLRKALDKFPNTTKVHSSVQIQKHSSIPEFKVAVVECAFCGKKEKHDIFDERVEEWKQLGEKKALCKTCALKLGKIFVWYNDFKDLFSVFQTKLQTLLSDFGDLSEYDNDDVIALVKGLKELLEAQTEKVVGKETLMDWKAAGVSLHETKKETK